MATYLILFFEVFALVVMIYSITHLIIYNKVLKKSKDTSVTYINKPDDEVNLLVVNKKGYKIYFNHDYYKKLKIVSVDEDKILLQHNKNEEIEIDIDSLINL